MFALPKLSRKIDEVDQSVARKKIKTLEKHLISSNKLPYRNAAV